MQLTLCTTLNALRLDWQKFFAWPSTSSFLSPRRGQEFQFVFLNIEPVWGGNYLVHDSADGWKSRGHNDSWTNAMGIDIALATWQAANWLLNGFWISSRHVTLLWIVVNKYLPSWHTRISLDHKVTHKFGPKTHIWHDFFPVKLREWKFKYLS